MLLPFCGEPSEGIPELLKTGRAILVWVHAFRDPAGCLYFGEATGIIPSTLEDALKCFPGSTPNPIWVSVFRLAPEG